MKKISFILLFIFILNPNQGQETDTLIILPKLKAFTHPEFFYSDDCYCSDFNFDFIYLDLYDSLTHFVQETVIPPNFDVGHPVMIIGKQGDFFKIIIEEGAPPYYEQQVVGKEFFVKKGTLGTIIYNYNDSIDPVPVPLYEKPSSNSAIIQIEEINGVAIILDIQGDWMFIETIGKGKKKRGWLDPKMQCGNPYGPAHGFCY